MTEETQKLDLEDRLKLIETMVAEGRRGTERWGWCFVFWGVAYYVAMGWAAWSHDWWAWPITMIVAVAVAMGIIMRRQRGKKASTTLGRSVGAVWSAMGISMMVIFPVLGMTGRLDGHLFAAMMAILLGTTYAASGMMLRWKAQLACAVVWWITAVVACFGSETQSTEALLAAIFLCMILFGVYCMIREAGVRSREARHA